jgi:tRNA (guanine37-N1)-methyltransferase
LLLNVSVSFYVSERQTLGNGLKKNSAVATAEGFVKVSGSLDIVGDIAITRMLSFSQEDATAAVSSIMYSNRGVKTVLAQTSKVSGEFRLRKLTCIGGENKTRTIHKEHGCTFAVDVETCYFSPRLSGERKRIALLVQPDETVVNMFSGVGCFSIIIAKLLPSAKVYSIDINPEAVEFMRENIRVNRVFGKVVPLLGDAKTIIQERLIGWADRVLMPLPEKAIEYLPCAISALKPSGGWIHIHLFTHSTKTENPTEKVKQKLVEALNCLGVAFEISFARVVRDTGPNWYQVTADVHIK